MVNTSMNFKPPTNLSCRQRSNSLYSSLETTPVTSGGGEVDVDRTPHIPSNIYFPSFITENRLYVPIADLWFRSCSLNYLKHEILVAAGDRLLKPHLFFYRLIQSEIQLHHLLFLNVDPQ